jgi:hypothetical protein
VIKDLDLNEWRTTPKERQSLIDEIDTIIEDIKVDQQGNISVVSSEKKPVKAEELEELEVHLPIKPEEEQEPSIKKRTDNDYDESDGRDHLKEQKKPVKELEVHLPAKVEEVQEPLIKKKKKPVKKPEVRLPNKIEEPTLKKEKQESSTKKKTNDCSYDPRDASEDEF